MILAALMTALVAPGGQQVPGVAEPAVSSANARARTLDAMAAERIAQAIAEAPIKGAVAPRALSMPVTSDFYPGAAIRAEQQGVVQLRCRLAVTGVLQDCAVAQSSGFPLLDAAAFQVALYNRFYPRIVDRVPEASEVVLPVRWALE